MAAYTYYTLKPDGINTGAQNGAADIIYARPRVDLKTKAVTGIETFIRPGAVRSGRQTGDSSENLDLTRLEELLGIMADFFSRGFGYMTAGVHISGDDLSDSNFVRELIALKKTYGLPHGAIEIELKGADLKFRQDYDELSINTLRKYGFNFSVHNFGEGVSLIDVLQRYPIDLLKFRLDMFGHPLPSEKERAMLTHIVRMSHAMDIPVLCECVETGEHAYAAELTESDFGAGEYLGAAVPAIRFNSIYG